MKFEDYTISFSDMLHIIKRHKRPILIWTISLSLFASFYVLSRPNVYPATAHFKELGKSGGEGGGSLSRLILGVGKASGGSQAISAMKSRTLLTEVVKKLGLQGSLNEKDRTTSRMRNIFDRIRVEWAHFRNRETVDIFCPDCPLKVSNIYYSGSTTIPLSIVFTSPTSFIVKNSFGNVGEGRLGHPFRTDHFAFTLFETKNEDLEDRSFSLALIPLRKMLDHLEGAINIEVDEDDLTLLILEYSHPKRDVATQVLNETMMAYQNYLKEEHDRSADTQLTYLKKRQEEMFGNQTKVMRRHAKILAKDLSSTGFVNFEKEMEFLFKNRLSCLEKINALDLKLQRLDHLLMDDQDREGQILTHEELTSISPSLQQLTNLKMQRDSLTLTLTQSQNHEKINLSDQISSLDQVALNLQELGTLIDRIQNDQKIDPKISLLQNSDYLVGEWVEKLDQKSSKGPCLAYLNNLHRLFEMQRRVVQERLAFQCQDHTEYQGIDLETTTQLQLAYIKESHQFESTQREAEFILEQLADPAFEINSLSGTLRDPISQEIIQKSTNLALQLRDQKYHSPKEQERSREELDTQKRFLLAHLKQTMGVQQLHDNLLQERIRALQGVMLGLIHEKISVLEKHINDYIRSQASSFAQQKELIISYMNEINQNMATLPEKWLSEQIIKQNVDLNKAIVEELTRLVESKNISHNLDLIQSSPLDLAWTDALPKRPRLLLVVIIGAIFGAFFSSSYFILKQMFIGVEATPDNLKMFNQNVVGTFMSEDLELMRHQSSLMDQLAPPSEQGHVLLSIENSGPHYIPDLSKLLSKKGQKILVLPLTSTDSEQPGLLQYLEGNSPSPKILHHQDYDTVSFGGSSAYIPELFNSSQFIELLSTYKEKYDWILCFTTSAPTSSEGQALLPLADVATLTIDRETLLDLGPYFECSQPVTYMFKDIQ
ncbi:MAG: hypothetical protein K940chlam3_00651 [Chlamydiae bacterium]|nr:hypothetical protein [Chlamydiota bacterium]